MGVTDRRLHKGKILMFPTEFCWQYNVLQGGKGQVMPAVSDGTD